MLDTEISAASRRILALVSGIDESSLLDDALLQDLGIDSSYAAAIPILLDAELGIYVSHAQLLQLLSSRTIAHFITAVTVLSRNDSPTHQPD